MLKDSLYVICYRYLLLHALLYVSNPYLYFILFRIADDDLRSKHVLNISNSAVLNSPDCELGQKITYVYQYLIGKRSHLTVLDAEAFDLVLHVIY